MDLEGQNNEIMPGDTIARSKAETDIEKHVLGATVLLSDGSEGFIFSRTPRNKDLVFGYCCHICGVVSLCGERMLQIHIAGRKHQARLNVNVFGADQYHATLGKQRIAIAGGDTSMSSNNSPVVPATKQEEESLSVTTVARLQSVLDGYRDGPLVGLEYIIELIDESSRNAAMNQIAPTYVCLMCELNDTNESGITTHMIGLEHRVKYLERHYPSVCQMLAPYRNANLENSGQVFFRVIQTLCEAIEDHHGRKTPQVYDVNDFERNRMRYAQQIFFSSHFNERTGPKFLDVVNAKVLQDLEAAQDGTGNPSTGSKRLKNREDRNSLDSISSVSSVNSMVTMSSKGDNHDDRGRQRAQSPQNGGQRGDANNQRSRQGGQSGDRGDRGGPTEKQQLLPTPRELSQQSAEIAHERYKWEKYRCTVEIAMAQLTKQLKEYEKNPEKHPLYSEEWKKFWNRRYKELQAEKKDPQKHNFKPEWIEFWTKRMQELHAEDVAKKKEEIRTKMNLPSESEERTDELREQYSLRVPPPGSKQPRLSESKSGNGASTSVAPIVIDSEDEEDDYQGGQPSVSRSKNRSPRAHSRRNEWSGSQKRPSSRSHRSRSPFSDDDRDRYSRSRGRYRDEYMADVKYREPIVERIDYDEWAKIYYGPNKKVFVRTEFEQNNEPLNLIAVCRLLTAFEEYLGSLGPKVIDLLAKALALEKVKANSADDLLLNEDNCMFLETVKEKLKGHMMAETIDLSKMVPVKKAVQNIARLVHEASKREPPVVPREEEPSRDSVSTSETTGPTMGPSSSTNAPGIDKFTVAEQLAKSLVAQGKTDFTTEELEQLIHVYMAMVKLSRERGTIITTQSYLGSLPSAPVKEAISAPASSKLAKSEPPRLDATAGKNTRWPASSGTVNDSPASNFGRASTTEPVYGTPSSAVMLENLTDSDLQTLLQGFKELSNEEQMHLISYLRKLERTEPERVDKLRRYVDFNSWTKTTTGSVGNRPGRDTIDDGQSDEEDNAYQDPDGDDDAFAMFRSSGSGYGGPKKGQGQMSNSNIDQQAPGQRLLKQQQHNMHNQPQQKQQQQSQQQQRQKDMQSQSKVSSLIIDSDEDDYSYDDIVRAASKNVSTTPQQPSKTTADAYDTSSNNSHRTSAINEPGTGAISLRDTQNLIANLMESLQKSVSDANSQSTANNTDPSSYTSPITTIGSMAANVGGNVGAASNVSASYPAFNQQQQQQQQQLRGQPGMALQQSMGLYGQQAQSQIGQMQTPMDGQYMYQGQMFGANGTQQMQPYGGYGNYGGYY